MIYTVAPPVCDVQGMQKGSAHLNEQTHQQGRSKTTIWAVFYTPHKDWKTQKLNTNPQSLSYPQNNPPTATFELGRK